MKKNPKSKISIFPKSLLLILLIRPAFRPAFFPFLLLLHLIGYPYYYLLRPSGCSASFHQDPRLRSERCGSAIWIRDLDPRRGCLAKRGIMIVILRAVSPPGGKPPGRFNPRGRVNLQWRLPPRGVSPFGALINLREKGKKGRPKGRPN